MNDDHVIYKSNPYTVVSETKVNNQLVIRLEEEFGNLENLKRGSIICLSTFLWEFGLTGEVCKYIITTSQDSNVRYIYLIKTLNTPNVGAIWWDMVFGSLADLWYHILINVSCKIGIYPDMDSYNGALATNNRKFYYPSNYRGKI